MRIDNYFKATAGSLLSANQPLQQKVFPFASESPSGMRQALYEATVVFGPKGTVSVWLRSPGVPERVECIGEVLDSGPDADQQPVD